MSAAEGLYEAARVLAEQAAFLQAKGHRRSAEIATAQSRQFEAMARQAQDSEPTDRKLYLGCPYCVCHDCKARRSGTAV